MDTKKKVSGDSAPPAENEDSIDEDDTSSNFSSSLVSLRVVEDDIDDVEALEIFDSPDADTD